MKQPVRRIESKPFILTKDDIDTDQICPARFLTTTSRDGFASALFADWDVRPKGASILVAGRNFGCGSSREHAVWALRDAGICAVIALSVADIFRRNAIKNGVVPVVVDEAAHTELTANPEVPVTVDVETMTVATAGRVVASFTLEPFARRCLIEGVDELGFLLTRAAHIDAYEGRASA